MHVWLTKDLGYRISLNRIENLYYNKMSLRSILPGPHTSRRNKEHKTYPLFTSRLRSYQTKSSLGYRYYLYTNGKRFYVFNCPNLPLQ